MKKFSEIPQFILNEYLSNILESAPESTTTSSVIWEEALFTDTNYVLWVSTDYVKWNLTYTIGDKSHQFDSYLRTPLKTIVTRGGKRIETYVETDEQFQEIGITPFSSGYFEPENDFDGYNYNFDISQEKYPTPSSTISYQVSGDNFNFVYYDAFSSPIYKTIDEKAGYNVYFRKGSIFYDWIEENYPEYMNTNKDFLFLGKIYPYFGYEWKCRIYRFLYKDFIINALPYNNRKPKLVKFITEAFDKIYSKTYNKITNIEKLYDNQEGDPNFIDDLSHNLYNINLGLYGIEKEDRLRELLGNVPIILKKKGTYSSLIGIWEMTSGFEQTDDVSDINIYEWWHDSLESGTYSVTEYDEINYKNAYNSETVTGCAGSSYYSRYTTSYPSYYQSNTIPTIQDSYIHYQQTEDTNWTVKHFVNTNRAIVQCYNTDFEEIFPKKVQIQDNSQINVEFNRNVAGYCIVIGAEYSEKRDGIYWNITHYINKKTVLTQSFNSVNERFSPVNTLLLDYDNSVIDVDPDSSEGGYGYFIKSDYVFYNLVPQTTWTISHGSGGLLFAQVYDENDNLIMPSKVYHNENFTTTYIEFSKETTGYVILKYIGSPNRLTEYGKTLSPHYKVEFDLTCKPIDVDKIFSDTTAENLLENWEDSRPANKVAHYHGVFAPITDFTGGIYGVYSERFDPYWKSTCSINRRFSDSSVHIQSARSINWEVTHDLKTENVIVKIYDTDYNEIIPKSIEIDSWYKILVNFEEYISGYAVVVASDEYGYSYDEDFYFLHNFDKYIISQFYTFDKDNIVFPENVKNYDDRMMVEGGEVGTLYISYGTSIWEQGASSNTWTINHNLSTSGIIAEFYDENWNKIIPESLTLTSKNTCTVKFGDSIKGYGVIKDTGFIEYKEDIINDLIDNGAVVDFGDGDDSSYIDSTSIISIQNSIGTKTITNTSDNSYIYRVGNNFYIDIELDIDDEYDLREIGIFSTDRSKLYFYSQGSQLYKYPGYTMTIHFRVNYEDI